MSDNTTAVVVILILVSGGVVLVIYGHPWFALMLFLALGGVSTGSKKG